TQAYLCTAILQKEGKGEDKGGGQKKAPGSPRKREKNAKQKNKECRNCQNCSVWSPRHHAVQQKQGRQGEKWPKNIGIFEDTSRATVAGEHFGTWNHPEIPGNTSQCSEETCGEPRTENQAKKFRMRLDNG